MVKSINEPGRHTFEGMQPGSINEPVQVPEGVLAPRITVLSPTAGNVSVTSTIYLTGVGFFGKSVVFINDIARATKFEADGRLSVVWKPMGVQTAKFRVRNGVYTSNSADFPVTPKEV